MEHTVQVLRQLPRISHPDLLVSTEHFDDAGVFRLDEHTALVQTVDFFPPLVDDPYEFGRVAAANALSDIYAMGGQPITALNIVGYPDKDLPIEHLCEILRGGAERIAVAGAVILGGHSVRDSEVKYGMAVTGRIDPARIITNGGAMPDDLLVLTKPLGSGVLTSAAKKGLIDAAGLAATLEVMTHLNKSGADAMAEVPIHAATDVTGFGLLGHAFEMAEASRVTLEIESGAVPLIGRVLEFAGQGVVTRAHKGTLAHLGDTLDTGTVDQTLVNVLADAQTSGGLLIAVPPESADALLAALGRHQAPCAQVIGAARSRTGHAIRLR